MRVVYAECMNLSLMLVFRHVGIRLAIPIISYGKLNISEKLSNNCIIISISEGTHSITINNV